VALEGEQIDDPFMARGVRLGVDGLSPELISETLKSELASIKQRHERGQQIFKFMSSTAPSMGLVGTIIGLVQMLKSLDDPDKIGPSMAVALLTTLYGALLAFLVFGPIAAKLATRTAEEVAVKKLAIAGVESILKGDNSMVIQSKLEAYLSPDEREVLGSD
jgi:chemotaxis protein MotA